MATRLIIVTGLQLILAAPAAAQWVNPDTCSIAEFSCQQAVQEKKAADDARYQEQRQLAENAAALEALRARLLAATALPPERNPLLGRWRIDTGGKPRGGDDLSQLMGMLSNPGGAVCEVVFGAGIVEFKPGSWASIDGTGDDSLGPIQYRMQDKKVFALPDQGLPLLGFDIVDSSTIREFRMPDCVLLRVGAQPTAAPVARVPQSATGAAAQVAPARSAREPIEPVSRLGRGVQLHGEKDFQQALQQLLVAAQSDPDDPRVYVYLADTYGWLGMEAEAKQAAERAKQLDPNAFDILR